MPDESIPRPRSPFYGTDGAPLHPVDALSVFSARIGIVDALGVDSVMNAPDKVVNALGELAGDFEDLEAAIEDWFRIHAGPSLTGPLKEGGTA